MTAVWEDASITNPTERLLLLALADHANDDGVCWPSIERLANRTCISPGQARRLISKLVGDGRIQADRRGGYGRTSTYRLIAENPRTHARVLDENTRAPTHNTRAPTHNTRAPTHNTRAPMRAKPPITTTNHQEPPIGGVEGTACHNGGGGEAAHEEGEAGVAMAPEIPQMDAATMAPEILAAWNAARWPLTAPLCKFLIDAARAYSTGELLAAIQIMHDSKKSIERPAAYLKRVLQRRVSAVVAAHSTESDYSIEAMHAAQRAHEERRRFG